MGEISFNYKINNELVYESSFKYRFAESIKYGFAYQRYVAFSDASIFNGPVAITKMATGLYQYYDLFIDKKAHTTIYNELINDISITKYSMQEKTKEYFADDINAEIENYQDNKSVYRDNVSIDIHNNIIDAKEKIDIKGNYLKERWLLKDYSLEVYFSPIIEKLYHNKLEIYSYIFQLNRTNHMKVLKSENFLTTFDNKLNVMYTNIFCETPYKALNVFDTYFSSRDVIILNKIPNIFLTYPYVLRANTIDRIFLKRSEMYQISLNKFITTVSNNEYANSNSIVSGIIYKRSSDIFKFTNVSSVSNNVNIDDMQKTNCNNLNAFYNIQYSIRLREKVAYNLDMNTFAILEQRYCFTINDVPVKTGFKNLSSNKIYQIYKGKENAIMNNVLITGDINTKNILSIQTITVNKFGKNVHEYFNQYFINGDIKKIHLFNNAYIGKFRKSFELYKDVESIEKVKNGFDIFNDSIYAIKDKLSTIIFNDILQYNKDNHKMYIFTDKWFSKDSHSFSLLLNHFFADKEKQCISIYQQTKSIIKNKVFIETIIDFDNVIKNYIPTNYSNILDNNYAGMIIPISKIRHQGYIDNINSMVKKVSKNGYISQDAGASVIPKDTYTALEELFCDKKEFETYIDYRNIQITKSKVHSLVTKNTFVDKAYHYVNVEGLIWAEKGLSSIWTDKQTYAKKEAKNAFYMGIFSSELKSQNVYSYSSLFIDKINQICYYNYNTSWFDKSLKESIEFQQYSVGKSQQELHMFDCVSPFIRNQIDVFYDYGVFTNNIIRESNLFKQIDSVHKKVYDARILPDDFGKWGWVYETPDPFNGLEFHIDELLLPENDTRYEDFQDIIFDKQNMRPRNPIKVINDHTFIAKYPIRHPLPKYHDVAINYNNSAVKFENFYGIETSVMHTVFLKFYRIWQSKIFEFGTMTMVQSVKLMLEYMYAWIMEYFPVEKIEQALRVFKLIRWYGETSIIQNSQYIVSYEYDTLESKLNTGTCYIPNDLSTNDTMYVDAHLGVIRNNPAYVNNKSAYVTFEIDNPMNTTFTFSLSNTVGSVNIYINDNLVDIVSKSALNLTYELPYTGDVNIVKIEKVASHNLNKNFYIGNIKVPNCSFKDLSIEFDPALKAGNKPLNEVAKKMIAFANLHDNKDEIYEIIKKGNLGVEEIYKHLLEYWEIHHQDKIKGKRLTIKEV